jgi:nucleoside-diphosphate-sugar epimerase
VFPGRFYPLHTVADHNLPNPKAAIIKGTPPINRAMPLDISRAGEALGWKPEYSLSDAFADYIADMKAQMG